MRNDLSNALRNALGYDLSNLNALPPLRNPSHASYALFSVNKISSLQPLMYLCTEIKHLSTLLTVESQHLIQMFGKEPSGPSEMRPK